MRVAFRVDASLQIGSGHVMRCLTLADALRAIGATCHFLSRGHAGHLLDLIRRRGHVAHELPIVSGLADADGTAHARWLGCDWRTDADQSAAVLDGLAADWLVVDHYALDARWEEAMTRPGRCLMAIDDLADRRHACELLLDQNLGRQPGDYAGLVPAACQVLAGPRYALLRPEFAALRPRSLARRRQAELKHVLVSMGGVDQDNATGRVLDVLRGCDLPDGFRLTVIMGGKAPWLDAVRAQAGQMPWPADVLVDISDMAVRMMEADLAIGAAGGTAWERCCLGLPALMIVLADNQWPGARALAASGAAWLVGTPEDIVAELPAQIAHLRNAATLAGMSGHASAVTDGEGLARVMSMMRAKHA